MKADSTPNFPITFLNVKLVSTPLRLIPINIPEKLEVVVFEEVVYEVTVKIEPGLRRVGCLREKRLVRF